MKKSKALPLILLVFIIFIFFKAFLLQGKLPIPSDTIVGLYHPFRDLYAKEYPSGIPFKNFLITDPVRQQYPWRELAISLEKKMQLPLWNPYSLSGAPLLANQQSAAFYPLNILFFAFRFDIGWSITIILGSLLASIFFYLYLNNLKLNKWASLIGAISFAFSGFSVAWMEWGTIVHVGLWLPLILLSIDKILFLSKTNKFSIFNFQFLIWSFIFIFSLASSFFAGHLQTFFYVFLVQFSYFIVRWFQYEKNKKLLVLFIIHYSLFIILTAVQWIPTSQLILNSARDIDLNWQKDGWFIPWQHLIQFVVPDFFGNPTTLNYFGVWNYAEFVGFMGIFPLMMGFFALFFRHDRKTLFYGTFMFLSIIFALPTIFAKIPYILNIPFISTSQPTRLLFITDFSLAVLAALGFDFFIRNKKKDVVYPIIFLGLILLGLWAFVLSKNLLVARQNLFFPTGIFILVAISILWLKFFPKIKGKFTIMIYIIIVGITVFDLLRFVDKFTPFTPKEYLFPGTSTLVFLQQNIGQFRLMSTDSRILPPNFSIIYRLQNIDGYDPLYLRRYGELIAASERGKPDISAPFGFNRIITPQKYESKIIDLLGVKYILSLSDLNSPKLKKVFQEGQTRIYENKNVFPRAFFISNVTFAKNKKEAINELFNNSLQDTAIVEPFYEYMGLHRYSGLEKGKVNIIEYSENKIVIETENKTNGFLVLTDSFYPTWKVKGIKGVEANIYRTDYNFRGIVVPAGKHRIEFYNTLF